MYLQAALELRACFRASGSLYSNSKRYGFAQFSLEILFIGEGAGGGGAVTGSAGTANTGSGGGGGWNTNSAGGGAGGSGVVIISVPTANYSGTTTGSPTVTTSGSNTIMKFTASGTYTA